MAKIVLLSVIAVSVSAQFADRRDHEFGNLRVNQEGELRASNQRHRNDHVQVGGFQNGNFAQSDGRLRTNLDSRPENYQPQDESPYVVEEGAAFRRPAQYDVHSSLARVVDISSVIQDNNERRVIENVESQDNRRRDQRRTNVNSQTEQQMGQNSKEQINSDQNSPRQSQENQNKFNTQQSINQESSYQTEGHTNSRQSGHLDNSQETGDHNRLGNQNTQQITVKNRNSAGIRNNKPVPNVNNDSPVIANQGYEKEAIDRELNNQLTRMMFSESVMDVTTKSNTKTTADNELPRNNSEKEEDRWIWTDGNVVKNETTTVTPTVDDRAAFVGDQCPTGQVKLNKVCVDVDD